MTSSCSPPAALSESYTTILASGKDFAAVCAALIVPETFEESTMHRIGRPAWAGSRNASSNIAAVGCDVVGKVFSLTSFS